MGVQHEKRKIKGTFIVNVMFRENATWQGEVVWADEKKTIFPQRTGTDKDDRWCIEFGRREDADKDGNGRRLVVGDREQTG